MLRVFLMGLAVMVMTSCTHSKPVAIKKEDREYKGVNFSKLFQKDRSYDALNNDMTAMCDRILSWSSKNWTLNESETKMVEGYIRQNDLFKQPGFGKEWLEASKIMFDRIFNDEQNMIAPALYQKLEDLYNESNSPAPAAAPSTAPISIEPLK